MKVEFLFFRFFTVTSIFSISCGVFVVFDLSGKGLISHDDLKKVLTNLGEKFNDEDITEMLKEADLNGDGMIDYEGE